jgi:hypothetical protein
MAAQGQLSGTLGAEQNKIKGQVRLGFEEIRERKD